MRLPNFIIIGAAKSGTTTLHEYLNRHPQVHMSAPKEPSFFIDRKRYKEWQSWNNWLADKGDGFLITDNEEQRELEWYSSLFEPANIDQICGEASTSYTHWPVYKGAPRNMFNRVPNAKLIYIMRHPVDRTYSHYVQLIKNAQVRDPSFEITQTFEASIEADPLYVSTSKYIEQIERYLEFFPRESFLFLFMEDLIKTPEIVLKEVCEFLGIDAGVDLIQSEQIVANTSKHHSEWYVRSKMTASFKSIPGVKALVNVLPQGLKDSAYALLKKLPRKQSLEQRYIPKPMLPETREKLLNLFREPNEKLSHFVGRDLSHWNH